MNERPSLVVDEFYKQLESAIGLAEGYANRDEMIACLSMLDGARRRLDKLTLDPTRR